MLGLIQIPNTSEAVDGKGTYTVFNIHVNGCYHGSFRYSQLLSFHQELKTAYPGKRPALEDFPGKYWFGAPSSVQLLARRVGLEKYLHGVCQDREMGTSEILKEFLIAIQKVSCGIPEPLADVEVFLVNGKSVTVRVNMFDRTDQVLEKVCAEIKISSEFTYFFGLFLEKESDDSWIVDRPLTDFECPYPSLQSINKISPHRITIRKSFWDPVFLPELCSDRVAKNLLYIEALASVAAGHWEISDEVRKQLNTFQRKSLKKEYLELVGTLHQYGFLQLDDLTIDHPSDNNKASIRVGKIEMVSYMSKEEASPPSKAFTYSLTKIRSWKLGGRPGKPWLKFFFQVGPGDFVPVGVVGKQAILLSYCLHSVVDELLRVRAKKDIRQPATHPIDRTLRDLPALVFSEGEDPSAPPPEPEPVEEEEEESVEDEATDSASQDSPSLSGSKGKEAVDSGTTQPKAKTTRESVSSTSSSSSTTVKAKTRESVSSTSDAPASTIVKAKPTTKEPKIKTPKKKMPSVSDVENPTFDWGTDDDL